MMKFFISLTLLLTATLNQPALAQSKTDSLVQTNNQKIEKIHSIKKLLAVAGTKKLTQQIMYQMLNSIKSQYPQVPQKAWDTFMAEINVDEMIDELIPIYSKYLTTEDVKGLIEFYQTPLGKKTLATLPQITQESTAVGQKYGIDAAKRALQKLEQEGYLQR